MAPEQSASETQYRDLVTSYLREDTRILASVLGMRRIFSSHLYEIYVCIYSGLMGTPSLSDDLVTCLLVFKEEKMRVMFKLWTDEISNERHEYIEDAVKRLESEGTRPYDLIKNGKSWSHLKFTENDRKALLTVGIEIPSSGILPP